MAFLFLRVVRMAFAWKVGSVEGPTARWGAIDERDDVAVVHVKAKKKGGFGRRFEVKSEGWKIGSERKMLGHRLHEEEEAMKVEVETGLAHAAGISVRGHLWLRGSKLRLLSHGWICRYFTLCGTVLRCHNQRNRHVSWRRNVCSVEISNAEEMEFVVGAENGQRVRLRADVRSDFEQWKHCLDVAAEMYLPRFYKLQAMIGEGAYGTVYRGKDRKNGKAVAVKRIPLDHHQQDSRSLVDEEAAYRFDNPHLIHTFDVFEHSDEIYLVMEYAGAGTLGHLLKQRTRHVLSEAETAVIVSSVLQGLEYMHARGIAHRDIKPENVLLMDKDPPFDAKLCDFGLSSNVVKPVHTERSLLFFSGEGSKAICGTALYAAPEMVLKKDYGVQVDLWSIGVLVYRMMSGMDLIGSDSFDFAASKIRHMDHVDLSGPEFTHFSADAKNFLHGLLEKDPQRRMTATQALRHPWIIKHTPTTTTTNIASLPDPPLHISQHQHEPSP